MMNIKVTTDNISQQDTDKILLICGKNTSTEEYKFTIKLLKDLNLSSLLSRCILYDTLITYGEDSIIKETIRKTKGLNQNESDFLSFLLRQRMYIAKKIKKDDISKVLLFKNMLQSCDMNLSNYTQQPRKPIASSSLNGFENISENQINNIFKLTSVFENSTTDLQFGYCENIGDGRGYTFGFVGFCSGTYDGTMVIEEYNNLRPGNILSKYLPVFKKIDRSPHINGTNPDTEGLEGIENDIKIAGSDQYFINSQINIARKLYIDPSQEKIKKLNLSLPITKGQFYDMYINHGESGALDIIKKVSSPLSNEKEWLNELLSKRMDVLADDKTWASSIDRIKVYQKLLKSGNTSLASPITFVCYGDTFVI